MICVSEMEIHAFDQDKQEVAKAAAVILIEISAKSAYSILRLTRSAEGFASSEAHSRL